MWIILHWLLSSYKCFIPQRSVNKEPEVWSDTCSFSEIGLRYSPPFPSVRQLPIHTDEVLSCLESTIQRTFGGESTDIEHVTCLAHKFLCYARATDQQQQHRDPTVHLHSRNSNVKCFAGYMLFLEEQLEARATGLTICLFDKQQLHTADLED